MSCAMHARPAALVGAAAALLALAPGARALTAEQVYAKVSPSVWRVMTYDADNLPLGQGSGVVVESEALVTNCHVLAKAKRVAVKREKDSFDAKLSLWDVKRDVCQLKVPGLKAPLVALADSAKVAVGQNVFAIGNPRGLELTMSSGLVSSLRRNEAGQLILIQTSAAISGGSSGGGLFDDQGRLIGLTTIGSVTGDAQNLNFAVPSDWVRELPQRHATAAAAAASAAAQAPAAAQPRKYPQPTDGSFAHIEDLDRLPYGNDRMREAYRAFLSRPLPRAFVISEGGAWQMASGTQLPTPVGPSSPVDNAQRECQRSRTGRCFVYAVDNRVVYQPSDAR
jgi:S1-C subfamily serine protease